MGKGRATKPTRQQKLALEQANLVPRNWLVLRQEQDKLVVVSRSSGSARTIRR